MNVTETLKAARYDYCGHTVAMLSKPEYVPGGRIACFKVLKDGNGTGWLDGYTFTGNVANAKPIAASEAQS